MNDFYFDELVLGGSLTALLYAYKKNLPILIDIAHVPFALEEEVSSVGSIVFLISYGWFGFVAKQHTII